jgi:heat shock protein HslJ
MVRLGAVLAALALFAGLGLAACGSGGDDEIELEGRSFQGTPTTGRELVADSELRVSFEQGRLALNAGCNNMMAPYELKDGRLELTGPLASTMMGCPEPLQRQDEWLDEFFNSGPEVVALGDGEIALRGEAVEIQLKPN